MYVVPSTQGTLPSLAYYPQSFLSSDLIHSHSTEATFFFIWKKKKKIRESLFHPFLVSCSNTCFYRNFLLPSPLTWSSYIISEVFLIM